MMVQEKMVMVDLSTMEDGLKFYLKLLKNIS